MTLNKWAQKFLKFEAKKEGIKLDKKLLHHYGFHYVRDQLVVFKHTVEHELSLNDTKLFEGLQSSNWNDVRLKPPPSLDSPIGWRVEFRSMDVPLAGEQVFLLSHAVQILERLLVYGNHNLNFYVPISLTDENFRRANLRNAAQEGKFFWRTNIYDAGKPIIEELTIAEIFEGKVSQHLIAGELSRNGEALGELHAKGVG